MTEKEHQQLDSFLESNEGFGGASPGEAIGNLIYDGLLMRGRAPFTIIDVIDQIESRKLLGLDNKVSS